MSLNESIVKLLEENSHPTLYDAIEYLKCTAEDSKSIENIPNSIESSLVKILSVVGESSFSDSGQLKTVLGDCYGVMDRSLDELQGRAPALIPEVAPRKRLKLGPFEASNICTLSDKNVYTRTVHPFESLIKSLEFSAAYFFEPHLSAELDKASLERIPCLYVDTPDQLDESIRSIEKESVIGLDLENHNYYSYHGFTCLIQISTASCDYLIDAIKLKPDLKAALPKILSSDKILKILHGAEHDNSWLQRDFDSYLVNVFDTFVAAKVLDVPKKSLSGLLYHYFDGLSLDKQFQLADWRARPLPKEMLDYARLDTHYLLTLWEKLKTALKEKIGCDGLLNVYKESSLQCLKLYKLELPEENKWKSVLSKSKVTLDEAQMTLVRRVCDWRDRRARELDVCHHALLANHWIVKLALSNPCSGDSLKKCLRDGYTLLFDRSVQSYLSFMNEPEIPRKIPIPSSSKLMKRPVFVTSKERSGESIMVAANRSSLQISLPQIAPPAHNDLTNRSEPYDSMQSITDSVAEEAAVVEDQKPRIDLETLEVYKMKGAPRKIRKLDQARSIDSELPSASSSLYFEGTATTLSSNESKEKSKSQKSERKPRRNGSKGKALTFTKKAFRK